jgi:hypothetical protein
MVEPPVIVITPINAIPINAVPPAVNGRRWTESVEKSHKNLRFRELIGLRRTSSDRSVGESRRHINVLTIGKHRNISWNAWLFLR